MCTEPKRIQQSSLLYSLSPVPHCFFGPSRTSPASALTPVHVAKLQGQFNKGVHVLPASSHRPSPSLFYYFMHVFTFTFYTPPFSLVTYVDEDENEILELSSNKTFLVTLKIPEECVTEEKLPDLLTKRLTDVYSSSPALSRYFTSVEIIDFSGENATITYHLHFGFPSEDHNFMKYVMSEELVLGVLQQDFHDQNVSGCETLGLDPIVIHLLIYF
uniref:Chromosome 3 open reading frame 52 n=1 Tax=Monodon monoceros TaxID=40151 RepID=A0A8C6F615_MONMO